MKKILRFAILLGVFIVPFVPLIVTGSMFFPYITGKNFTFRIITEIIFALWLILALWHPEYRPKKSWLIWTTGALLIAASLATVFSVYPYKSFWSNFERMEGLVTYIHLFLYFIVVATMLKTNKLWFWFFNTWVASNVIMLVYGFNQLATNIANHQSIRLDAQLGNAAYLAGYILFSFFVLAFVWWHNRQVSLVRYLYPIIGILDLIILYYTQTRGAIVGLIGGIFLVVILGAILYSGRIRKTSLSIVGLLIVLILVFVAARNTTFVKNSPALNRLASISPTETTTQSRFLIWQMALKGVVESPKTILVGWGPESFNYIFNKFYDPQMWKQEPWFDRSHNIFLDWLSSAGIIGLLSYLSIFAAALYIIWKKSGLSKFEKALLTGLLSAYIIHNMFVFDNLVSYLVFYSLLGYLYYIDTKNLPEVVRTREKEGALLAKYVSTAAIVILGIFSVYYFNIPNIASAQELVQAISVYGRTPDEQATAEKQAYSLFQDILQRDRLGSTEAREQLMQYAIKVAMDQNAPNELKNAFFQFAASELQKQVDRTPNDARYQLFFGSFLATFGQFDQALAHLETAHELSPGKQAILFQLGQLYSNPPHVDYAKALGYFKQAFDLDPSYPEARNIYAYVALISGDKQLSDQLLEQGYHTTIGTDDRFLNYYAQNKQYDKLIAGWRARVSANPTDLNARKGLSSSYLLIGNKAAAVANLEDYLKLKPEDATAVNQLIGQVNAR